MKKIIFACMMLTGVSTVKAQPMARTTNYENNSNNTPNGIQQDNEFANTEITNEKGKIIFSDLPDLDKATLAVVCEPGGAVIMKKKVTPGQNSMDLRGLQKGQMYFLTLVYKKKSKKAFVLHM